MASLNKLAIRGIRSFDDKQIAVIEFFSPVTVIVGHNGSGKTTIIESLKYATTGDQPPNTRGGAFIHDPKMANEKEVKAQVKLRFHAANGTRMLAVRNLSVTVKKTGLTMKTLESILAVSEGDDDRGAKRGVISTKCAEMDAEIPHLLGVSKSVLENVIFCHQEDSYWPLSEPSALKKKFDDIFEATRYTKALDSIKSLRKDRVAELKAEKERLDSLTREKTHADKLRNRISDLTSNIASKEMEYEETKKQYDAVLVANQRFQDLATKFREMYIRIENLESTKKRYKEELDSAKMNVQILDGTDEELEHQLRNFDSNVVQRKQQKRREEDAWQDLEDELKAARRAHVSLIDQRAEYSARAKSHEEIVSERESHIRTLVDKYSIRGFAHTLEKEKVAEFTAKMRSLKSDKEKEHETLQSESRSKDQEYNQKYQKLQTDLSNLKLQKDSIRDTIARNQASISEAEAKLDVAQTLPGQMRTIDADIEEKNTRLSKIREDMKKANYEGRINESTTKTRNMEDRRTELTTEISKLSLQADSRAKLELKRTEVKTKQADVTNTLDATNTKFRKLVGKDARVDTMERELDRVSGEKERELADLELESQAANKELQQAEAKLSSLQSQAKAKRDEVKALAKRLREETSDYESLQDGLTAATDDLKVRREDYNALTGSSTVYAKMLRLGKLHKTCTACKRHMNDKELREYERHLQEEISRGSADKIAAEKKELGEWEQEFMRLQGLVPVQTSHDQIKDTELPNLEQQIKDQESAIPVVSERAEEVQAKAAEAKRELKDLTALKQHANHVSRVQKDIERLTREISNLERDLSLTGSTKTADDVQIELDALSADIRAADRERQSLQNERDRQSNTMRSYENDLHDLQMQRNNIANQLRDKETLESSIDSMKKEITGSTAQLKNVDSKMIEAQAPLTHLEREHDELKRELNVKIAEAYTSSQDVNRSLDVLERLNKQIDQYIRGKHAQKLADCTQQVEEHEERMRELQINIENVRTTIAKIDKEINEAGASTANLRENIRIRKLNGDIMNTQAEINKFDMEEAAKSRRNYEEKYKVEKARETDLQSKCAYIGGEVNSHRSQLETWEADLEEFKDINKQYTDQLLKVKMSEMANSDLEKYAKALDNAIMKYHSLKMEEVNDTMRHLWNKTYQGTDIDGIKVRSDAEGGASKRSYNYRVVMTKDQVEMDMRGRCSAGQKMLASIIIRLALSDSFGQNCGILALDEPTNALDTENIDALAASLVDIINERRNHSSFQLIIITHDENFLRKLGQNDVMEYYWRVSRDSRQKSVIERQRFR